jgi:hypothetical protein
MFWSNCRKEGDNNVITFLYGDGVVEKVMARGNIFPFFLVVLLF